VEASNRFARFASTLIIGSYTQLKVHFLLLPMSRSKFCNNLSGKDFQREQGGAVTEKIKEACLSFTNIKKVKCQ
jgi:hypothetical protein